MHKDDPVRAGTVQRRPKNVTNVVYFVSEAPQGPQKVYMQPEVPWLLYAHI